MPGTSTSPWWRDAVFYQVYLRSFRDSDGDGIGDLAGVRERLPYLAELGVDAVWLTPFYPTPDHDQGYDIVDHRAVDPRYGTLADLDALLADAHALGLRVMVDIVPNHTSSEHPWFVEALAAGPDGAARRRYHFRPGRGIDGAEPPNNWSSFFGGSAWTRVPDGEWYLHLFDSAQPDLDWARPDVVAMFDDVLRFWLDRGVDGIRIDVAHGLVKAAGLPDQDAGAPDGAATAGAAGVGGFAGRHSPDEPMWDQPGVHEIYRRWRRLLESYPGQRVGVAEAWARTPEALARYVRPDELHQAFNFDWLAAPWGAGPFAEVVRRTLTTLDAVGASPTWVLSNHDVARHVTRYGGGARGLTRARAATATMLGLPGSAYLYQGEELGLPEAEVPPTARQDPIWRRTGVGGRDGCRVPLPWAADAPQVGFGPGPAEPWLPQPPGWEAYAADRQERDPSSTLAFYREVLRARRTWGTGPVRAVETDGDVLAVVRDDVWVVLNCGDRPVPLPGGRVLVASGPVDDARLPPDTAVWLAVDEPSSTTIRYTH